MAGLSNAQRLCHYLWIFLGVWTGLIGFGWLLVLKSWEAFAWDMSLRARVSKHRTIGASAPLGDRVSIWSRPIIGVGCGTLCVSDRKSERTGVYWYGGVTYESGQNLYTYFISAGRFDGHTLGWRGGQTSYLFYHSIATSIDPNDWGETFDGLLVIDMRVGAYRKAVCKELVGPRPRSMSLKRMAIMALPTQYLGLDFVKNLMYPGRCYINGAEGA